MALQLRELPPLTRVPGPSTGRAARAINVALGIWLVVSGAIFPQANDARLVSYLAGAAIALVASLRRWRDGVRYVNTALAVWLAFSPGGLFRLDSPAAWNVLAVALLVFVFSLFPARPEDS